MGRMTLRFVDFADLTAGQRADAARVLRDAFAHMPDAFDGEFDAEVDSFFDDEDREAFAAFDGETLLGWIGRIETYDHAWELHPLVVDPPHQRRGVGAALVRELETRVKNQGALTLYLGTDDDFGGTSLFGADLFPGVARHIPGVRQVGRGHPFAFYQKLGYEIVGLIPDANGPGKPDIMMARRL
jgi:aminoglycoside 6'-N-acetyltransferase I